MGHNLRDYQLQTRDAVLKEFEGASSTLVVWPTGCVSGETVIGINRAGKGYSREIRLAYLAQADPRVKNYVTTRVRSFDNDRIILNPIDGIVSSGTKATLELTLENGKKLRATPDHEILTENGFLSLGNFTNGHSVICEAPFTRRQKSPKKHYRQVQGLVYHQFAGLTFSNRQHRRLVEGYLYRVPYHRLVAEASLNGISVEELIRICRGSELEAAGLKFYDPEVYAVRHKDDDETNNTPENLEVLTHSDHHRKHGQDSKWRNLGKDLVCSSKVKNVVSFDDEPTFDVVCKDPIRNFSANGIIVHNCGKTVLAADIIKHFAPKRSLFLAHRDTLIFQSQKAIEHHAKVRCDIEMAEHKANGADFFERATCVIATVQTLIANDCSRLNKFDPKDFSLLVVDEGHHYTSPAWKKPLEYFRSGNPSLKVLGITATPDRHDEQALGQIFETVAFDYEILDAIHGGWLVPIDQQMVKINGLDYSHIRVTAGDLNGADLARVMENEKNCQGIAGASIEIIKGKQAVVFTASVAQAEALSAIFNRHKQNCAEWIYEGTQKDDRKAMLERFRTKQTQIICNCGILTEGWDDRGVEVCIMARPTRSRALYAQMVGRILRPLAGLVDGPETAEERKAAIAGSDKKAALIVDFVGNAGKHKLMTSADILGGKLSDEAVERAVKKATEDGEAVRMDRLLDLSEEEIKAEIEKRRQEEEARKARLVAKVKWQAQQISPFDVLQIQPVRERGWDMGRTLSLKQRSLLNRQGIDADSVTYAQGRQLIGNLFSRWENKQCSFKQARILRKHGYSPNLSQQEASAVIDLIAHKEGWPQRKKS